MTSHGGWNFNLDNFWKPGEYGKNVNSGPTYPVGRTRWDYQNEVYHPRTYKFKQRALTKPWKSWNTKIPRILKRAPQKRARITVLKHAPRKLKHAPRKLKRRPINVDIIYGHHQKIKGYGDYSFPENSNHTIINGISYTKTNGSWDPTDIPDTPEQLAYWRKNNMYGGFYNQCKGCK